MVIRFLFVNTLSSQPKTQAIEAVAGLESLLGYQNYLIDLSVWSLL
jgi:hypothetical protein